MTISFLLKLVKINLIYHFILKRVFVLKTKGFMISFILKRKFNCDLNLFS